MTDQWARLEILRLVHRAQNAEQRCERMHHYCDELEAENKRLRTAIEHVNAVLREHQADDATTR